MGSGTSRRTLEVDRKTNLQTSPRISGLWNPVQSLRRTGSVRTDAHREVDTDKTGDSDLSPARASSERQETPLVHPSGEQDAQVPLSSFGLAAGMKVKRGGVFMSQKPKIKEYRQFGQRVRGGKYVGESTQNSRQSG
jgi:hypothetical protein